MHELPQFALWSIHTLKPSLVRMHCERAVASQMHMKMNIYASVRKVAKFQLPIDLARGRYVRVKQ